MSPTNITNGHVNPGGKSKRKNHGKSKVTSKGHLSKLQQLSNILYLEKTRMKGIMFMPTEIPALSKEKFIRNCVKWMHICCSAGDYYDTSPALNNLQALIEKSAEYSELNGSVSHFLRVKFFGQFFKHFYSFEEGWKCAELCLKYYKGSCSAYQERLRQAAISEIEKNIVSTSVARVYALLPIIGESGNDGVNYTNKWKNQFEDILITCNSILHDLFKDVVESQTYDDNAYQQYCNAEDIDELFLYKLFYNYCSVLQFMLLCSFPAPKNIIPQKVFNVVCRCLNVTSKTLGNLDTAQKIRLANALPQFHIVANSLLKEFIVTCRANLLPYSLLITKLMNQCVQSTQTDSSDLLYHSYLSLRFSAFETWRKWALVSNSTGALGSHNLAVMALNEISGDNETSKTAGASSCNPEVTTQDAGNCKVNHPLQKKLCLSALRVLQVYIRDAGATLPADQFKAIQICVVKCILRIQRTSSMNSPYSSSECRYELYSLLTELVNCQNSKWGSPVNWAVDLFKKGLYDSASKVSSFCCSALRNVQNIVDQEVIRIPPLEETMQTD
ncbi:UNVERIFIED_CONTAM: hypothetical protein PYX00_007283 [Menopon gallinae]|uniref:Uncharacterized protein n=1 Tax=Menopon gallinae TaxID=328185 RepID=A0AAW2HIN8_9NEOP